MNTTSSPQGFALFLIVVGALVMMAATVGLLVTNEQAWRLVIAAGGTLQVAGWLLHGRRLRGGAA
ncbi:hypothetical protein KUF83_25275 [Streptomyces sp. BV286]|uniref:hypothetical protein n=1 Tax=Streptomyces sp. BV286 TaxID=2849672 RepID=UPI001C2ED798|nr:hypothetical protein [Streptomyces sp. BV286]MBV1939853.1 hypothetical protein [Streptomyces sp. BV286]